MTATAVDVPVWRFYDVSVARVRRITPSFVRVTFTGDDLTEIADNGYDQRVKLLLPAPDGGFAHLASGPSWYADWRRLPDERRPPIRTYTVREVRTLPSGTGEVDIDMVLHGDTGPASRFAARAEPGDRAMLLGPNSRYAGRHGGLEFRPPAGHVGPTLLAGDQTAVPALLSILAALPEGAYGEAVLEVPVAGDITDARVPPGVRVTWLGRGDTESGLPGAVREAVARIGLVARPTSVAAPDPDAGPDAGSDDEPLWDVPEQAAQAGVYAWLAGESSIITGLRRYLVRDLGVDRGGVAFMGYWKQGRAEC
jgi:NADPH-dependent ferric siderophore reductase